MAQAVVIGAGPAGLMAAEELARSGHAVLIADAKPSVARKLLMAGKSGLNLTKDEPFDRLISAYGDSADWLYPMIAAFDADAVQSWARELGQDLFTGSTGRVFPKSMKASPLLRSWLARLETLRVEVRTGWRWLGWDGDTLVFNTPSGQQNVAADATILALGGASWARLGSDGAWASVLKARCVPLASFAPSNSALSVDWSHYMVPHFGQALKSVWWRAGDHSSRGEAVISTRGLEGGGLYPLTPALRQGANLHVDLVPDRAIDDISKRLSAAGSKTTLTRWLKSAMHLPASKVALFHEMTQGLGLSRDDWVKMLKNLPVHHSGLRPMDEAISTAGGVMQHGLDAGLMLNAVPGVFCAGEMLDWEAPTGGYLLTACLATGRWAGRSAADWLDQPRPV
ncbi:MAG: TIGR03862 family flavoprotein [Ruegeria sp.]